MGALIAFELARELRRRGAPDAVRLFVAGFAVAGDAADTRAPPDERPRPDRGTAAISAARQRVLLNDPEYDAPRASDPARDFSVIETYRRRDETPLDIPISGLAGAEDREAPAVAMTGWGRHSSAGYRLTVFAGDHFFVHAPNVRQAVIEVIARDLFQTAAKVA